MAYEYAKYIEHHGIKGQKWGVRRYQNSDGSLTEAGKRRYGVDSSGKMSEKGESRYKKDTKKYLNKLDQRQALYKGKMIRSDYVKEHTSNDKRASKYSERYKNNEEYFKKTKQQTRDILNTLTAKGFKISSHNSYRIANRGKAALKTLLFSNKYGSAPVLSAWDRYRNSKYSDYATSVRAKDGSMITMRQTPNKVAGTRYSRVYR